MCRPTVSPTIRNKKKSPRTQNTAARALKGRLPQREQMRTPQDRPRMIITNSTPKYKSNSENSQRQEETNEYVTRHVAEKFEIPSLSLAARIAALAGLGEPEARS